MRLMTVCRIYAPVVDHSGHARSRRRAAAAPAKPRLYLYIFVGSSVKVKVAKKFLQVEKLSLKNEKKKKRKEDQSYFFSQCHENNHANFVSHLSRTMKQGFEAKMFRLSLESATKCPSNEEKNESSSTF